MRNNTIALISILVLVLVALYIVLPLPKPEWLARSEVQGGQGNLMGLKLGLDLQGGTQVVLEADVAEGQLLDAGTMDTAKTIVEKRVNGLGVSEAVVQKQGENRIIAELPGVSNPDQAVETVRSTGQLEFVNPQGAQFQQGMIVNTTHKPTAAAEAQEAIDSGLRAPALIPYPQQVFETVMTGDVLKQAVATQGSLGEWQIGFILTGEGSDQFYAYTSQHIGQPLAIVLDGVVQSAPSVNQPSFSGGVDITGSFSESEAKDLARVLKSGALPVRLQVQAVQTVSPTLGSDSLRAAIVSGLIGVGLVLLFMLLYYRSLAAVVVVGLAISGLIQWNVISLLSRTNGLALSLAGIAGIIVSIGVTVDSYVVFFEKLKDEVKAGRSLRNSAERGFKSAWRTILAADIVSLLGAFTLWYLTVGSVRGFAFFLGLSTLCDMVVAWFFTRPTMLMLARSEFVAKRRVFGVDPSPTVPGGVS